MAVSETLADRIERYVRVRAAGWPALALRVSKDGHPSHPLYLPYDLEPVAYAA